MAYLHSLFSQTCSPLIFLQFSEIAWIVLYNYKFHDCIFSLYLSDWQIFIATHTSSYYFPNTWIASSLSLSWLNLDTVHQSSQIFIGIIILGTNHPIYSILYSFQKQLLTENDHEGVSISTSHQRFNLKSRVSFNAKEVFVDWVSGSRKWLKRTSLLLCISLLVKCKCLPQKAGIDGNLSRCL